MRNPRWIVLGALLLVIGGLGWLFHLRFELVKVPQWRGYQGEATRNDFLAAQRLLTRLGHAAASVRGVPGAAALPPVSDTLILPRRRLALSREQAQVLAGWVERGGTLVAAGLEPESPEAAETRDPLFQAFGVRLVLGRDLAQGDGIMRCAPERALPGAAPLQVRTGTRLQLQGPREEEILGASRQGPQLARLHRGRGTCWLITQAACFANPALEALDHPDFLAALPPRDSQVWIVAWEQPASSWTWLRAHALPILVSLAALGAASLAAAAPRPGPLQAEPEGAARRFLEHLDASGAYLWRSEDGRTLLQATRAAFHRRMGQVHPAWTQLPPDELCLRLARHAGLPEERVFRALRYDTATDPQAFLEAIQTLEILRKRL